jgi:hypothetical protein
MQFAYGKLHQVARALAVIVENRTDQQQSTEK